MRLIGRFTTTLRPTYTSKNDLIPSVLPKSFAGTKTVSVTFGAFL